MFESYDALMAWWSLMQRKKSAFAPVQERPDSGSEGHEEAMVCQSIRQRSFGSNRQKKQRWFQADDWWC